MYRVAQLLKIGVLYRGTSANFQHILCKLSTNFRIKLSIAPVLLLGKKVQKVERGIAGVVCEERGQRRGRLGCEEGKEN